VKGLNLELIKSLAKEGERGEAMLAAMAARAKEEIEACLYYSQSYPWAEAFDALWGAIGRAK